MAAADMLRDAMLEAERRKTGEILLKELPGTQGDYVGYRESVVSAINRCAPKSHRNERDEYIRELNDGNVLTAALLVPNDHPLKTLDEALYDAILQAATGHKEEEVLKSKLRENAVFGNGRQAIRAMDVHFGFQGDLNALTATGLAFTLTCSSIGKADATLATFRRYRKAMGTGAHQMSDVFGISVSRQAFGGVEELKSSISNHRAGANPMQLAPLVTSLEGIIAEYRGEEEKKKQQGRAAAGLGGKGKPDPKKKGGGNPTKQQEKEQMWASKLSAERAEKLKNVQCRNPGCGKWGHYADKCPLRQQSPGGGGGAGNKGPGRGKGGAKEKGGGGAGKLW